MMKNSEKHMAGQEKFSEGECGKLLYYQDPFYVKEAYRSARTNLMFLPKKEGSECQIFVVTSANVCEGKSINSSNLAIALSQNDKKVLLIDCDMRKPKIARLMHFPHTPGLSEYLAGMEKVPKIHECKRADGLYVLTSGATPPNPTELLSSPAMKHMLEELSGKYDYILLDTPPVNMVADSLVLTELVTGYILVVRANKTNQSDIDQALMRLQQVDAHVLGFLLNDVNPKTGAYNRYSHYGHGYGYGYGYGYGNKSESSGNVQKQA